VAHAIITRQYSGGGIILAGIYVTASTMPLQNQQSLFKAVKCCQIQKL
jgi:hypothetical protein